MKIDCKVQFGLWALLMLLVSSAYGSMLSVVQTELLVVFNLSKPLPSTVIQGSELKGLESHFKPFFQQAHKHAVGYIVMHASQPIDQKLTDNTFSNIKLDLKLSQKTQTAEEALLQATGYLKKYIAKQKVILLITDKSLISNTDPISAPSLSKALYYKLLPDFQKNKIIFHTFALNDFLGSEDIYNLSQKTNGLFKINRERTLLTALPIHNNRFIVDKNLEEIVLSFDSLEPNIQIKIPTGIAIKPNENQPNILWKQKGQYHTVLLKKPIEGIWEIKGKIQHPKIELVSDLKLSFKPVPENIFLGEENEISVYFLKNDKIVDDLEFIQKMNVSVNVKNEALTQGQDVTLNDRAEGSDEYPQDGVFSSKFIIHDTPGIYDIGIKANAIGVTRGYNQKVFVHDYPVKIKSDYDIETKKLVLTAKIKSPLVSQKNFDLSLNIQEDNGRIRRFLFEAGEQNTWVVTRNVSLIQEVERFHFQLNGQTQGGRNISVQLPKIDIDDLYFRAEKKYHILRLKRIRTEDPVLGTMLLFSNERRRENIIVDMMIDYPKFKKYWQRKYTTFHQEMSKLIFGLYPKVNNVQVADKLLDDSAVEVVMDGETKSLSELEHSNIEPKNKETDSMPEKEEQLIQEKVSEKLPDIVSEPSKIANTSVAGWGAMEVIMLLITSLFSMMAIVMIVWVIAMKRQNQKETAEQKKC